MEPLPINIDGTRPFTALPNTKNLSKNQENDNKFSKRSNSCVENKFKFTITSERLSQLRKIVEIAVKEHKIFTIKGKWPVIRRELLRRNWIEKYENNTLKKGFAVAQPEDLFASDLPTKQDWESLAAYTEKCENTIMSRMLQNCDVDFYWSMRKENSDIKHRANGYKLINRFSRSLFSSKEGLTLLLQQSYWYTEPGVANVNTPRCYVLGFPDHYNLFVDDFRITACMSVLKWFCLSFEQNDNQLFSDEGKVSFDVLTFALQRCEDYLASQNHLDIDKTILKVLTQEWNEFLTNVFILVHENGKLLQKSDLLHEVNEMYDKVKEILKQMFSHWPEFDIDGMRNIWIIKPGNKCRGRGIFLTKKIEEVDKLMGLKGKYVVQKYIERPLIIYDTKFDIRQWFMVTSVQPLTIWMYKECYLRFSSQIFSLNSFHESLHLTNHAVQCKYQNMEERNKALPADNMWDLEMFQSYLNQIGYLQKWNDVIFPGMRESIICTMLASQDTMDRRQNTFELYGADFMLSENFQPWLLEINCSPDLSLSTTVTSRLCPQCMEDIIKVIIDKRKDTRAITGSFEMIYKQNLPRTPAYLGVNLSIRGRKIFRNKNKLKQPPVDITKPVDKSPNKMKQEQDTPKINLKGPTNIILPKLISCNLYKGPIISDLIKDLKKSNLKDDYQPGLEFSTTVVDSDKHKTKEQIILDKFIAKKNEKLLKRNLKRYKSNRRNKAMQRRYSASRNNE